MVKIINPSVEIVSEVNPDVMLKTIEKAARTCYKTENNISEDTSSAVKMITKLIDLGHTAMIEFADIHVKLITDTGVLKDLSRHRHCSFAVESTRYCNYSKGKFGTELTFIKPCHINTDSELYNIWFKTMQNIEESYMKMAKNGALPDQLRMILPHSLKTEINIKANMREWRYILKLRCSKAAHPSVREVMLMLLNEFHSKIPVLFDDIFEEYKDEIR